MNDTMSTLKDAIHNEMYSENVDKMPINIDLFALAIKQNVLCKL